MEKKSYLNNTSLEDLTPIKTDIQNINDYYKKYGKRRRAEKLLEEQIDVCEENIRYLESIELSLASCTELSEISDIRSELISSGLLRESQKKKPGEKVSRPFRFRADDGTEILVGKNNTQNDRLTFRIAARDDLWLHTKDIPGSHVILRTGGVEPDEQTLLLAASLAAHFSQASGSSNIPVDYTRHIYASKNDCCYSRRETSRKNIGTRKSPCAIKTRMGILYQRNNNLDFTSILSINRLSFPYR